MLLTLSLLAIIIGPVILHWFPSNRRLDNFLFSFVLVSVGGILALDIVPTLWQHIGFWFIPLALLGFLGPSFIESSFHKAADKAHNTALILGIFGLVLHSGLDGLAVIENTNNQMMPYAVILHRIVVGLSIWWLVQPIWGNTKSYLVFLLIIIATLIGYYLGLNMVFENFNFQSLKWLDYFQSIIAGTLLHVIIHRPHIDDDGHIHDHSHALEHDPEHSHSHGIVIKHKEFFAIGVICALFLLYYLHQLH